jgi:hypothetical protein
MDENAPKPGSQTADPLGILRTGIQAVPAVQYAAGVAGVIAAAALVKAFFSSTQAALLVGAAMLVLMTILLVFAAATKLAPAFLQPPALVFTWATLSLFILSASLTVSSVFFRWPDAFPELVKQVFGESLAGRPTLFHCGATNDTDQCWFVLWTEDALGNHLKTTQFVVGHGDNRYVEQEWRGGKFCVTVGPKFNSRQPKWPENCPDGYPHPIGDVNF